MILKLSSFRIIQPSEYLSYENFNFEIKKGGAHAH